MSRQGIGIHAASKSCEMLSYAAPERRFQLADHSTSGECTGSGIVLRMGALHIGQVVLPVGSRRRCCCSCCWMHSKHTSMCMQGSTCKQ